MAPWQFFNDPSVPSNPVYWVEAFGNAQGNFGSFQDGGGPGVTISYGFKETGMTPQGFPDNDDFYPARVLTEGEKDNVRDALQKIQAYADITFVETAPGTADLLAAAGPDTPGFGGLTFFTGPVEIWVFSTAPIPLETQGLAYKHELLHALGLDHSTLAFGSQNPVVIPDAEDNGTTLYGNLGFGVWFLGAGDYQLFDIAALQYLYGPPPSKRAGNDTYALNPGVFDPLSPQIGWPLLWDGGGTDTLNYSALAVAVNVSLNPGELSRIGGATGGILTPGVFSINYRTVIENANGGSGNDTLRGNDVANVLNGGGGNDRLIAGNGNDTMDGGTGIDRFEGGAGDDTYTIDSASEVLVEVSGVDLVRSNVTKTLATGFENLTLLLAGNINGTGNDTNNVITGNGGVNTLAGLGGNDRLIGLGGNDALNGGAGIDRLEGGAGNDTYTIDSAGDILAEISGIDLVRSTVAKTLATGFDNLTLLGTANLAGTGNAAANVLTGNTGANKLSGLGGNDRLIGGNGNDTLDGGANLDRLEGGAGNDTYTIDSASDVLIEISGLDLVRSTVTKVLATGFENLTLVGTTNLGGTGNAAANVLTGNTGANKLVGLGGNDKLNGGSGNDSLAGGLGVDTMTGGTGKDFFQFVATLVGNIDAITDYNVAADTIQLKKAIFAALGQSVTANEFFKGPSAHDADDRLIYSSTTGALIYDSNGNASGGAVQFATLSKNLLLTHADFAMV